MYINVYMHVYVTYSLVTLIILVANRVQADIGPIKVRIRSVSHNDIICTKRAYSILSSTTKAGDSEGTSTGTLVISKRRKCHRCVFICCYWIINRKLGDKYEGKRVSIQKKI